MQVDIYIYVTLLCALLMKVLVGPKRRIFLLKSLELKCHCCFLTICIYIYAYIQIYTCINIYIYMYIYRNDRIMVAECRHFFFLSECRHLCLHHRHGSWCKSFYILEQYISWPAVFMSIDFFIGLYYLYAADFRLIV